MSMILVDIKPQEATLHDAPPPEAMPAVQLRSHINVPIPANVKTNDPIYLITITAQRAYAMTRRETEPKQPALKESFAPMPGNDQVSVPLFRCRDDLFGRMTYPDLK